MSVLPPVLHPTIFFKQVLVDIRISHAPSSPLCSVISLPSVLQFYPVIRSVISFYLAFPLPTFFVGIRNLFSNVTCTNISQYMLVTIHANHADRYYVRDPVNCVNSLT